jgi:hypothetical protein
MTAVSATPVEFGHNTKSVEPSMPIEVGRLLPPVFVEQLPVAISSPAASHPDGRHPEQLESPTRLAFRRFIYERSLELFRRDTPAATASPQRPKTTAITISEALQALEAEGAITAATGTKEAQRLVVAQLGYRHSPVPRGLSIRSIGRQRQKHK